MRWTLCGRRSVTPFSKPVEGIDAMGRSSLSVKDSFRERVRAGVWRLSENGKKNKAALPDRDNFQKKQVATARAKKQNKDTCKGPLPTQHCLLLSIKACSVLPAAQLCNFLVVHPWSYFKRGRENEKEKKNHPMISILDIRAIYFASFLNVFALIAK